MERTKFPGELYAQELYSSDAYLVINKRLLQKYGPDVTIFLSNLIDKYRYFREHGTLIDNKWFYLVHEQQMDQTGMSLTRIQNSKRTLQSDGVIELMRKGTPSKEYYSIDFYRLSQLIPFTTPPTGSVPSGRTDIKEDPPSPLRASLQDSTELALGISEGIYKVKENKLKENKVSVPPTLEEVRVFCRMRNNRVDPEQFFNFYSSKNWMVGKNKMTNWHASIYLWEKEEGNRGKGGKGTGQKPKPRIIRDGRTWFLQEDGYYRDANGVRLEL